MAHIVKDWKNAPDTSTPISAEALEDLETRLGAYADQVAEELATGLPDYIVSTAGEGAVGNGAFADTVAVISAVNRINTTPGKGMLLLDGSSNNTLNLNAIVASLAFTKPCIIAGVSRGSGSGAGGTYVQTSHATLDGVFDFQSEHIHCQDFVLRRIGSTSRPTAGCGIKMTSGAYQTFSRVRVSSFYDNVKVDQAYEFHFGEGCLLVGAFRWNLLVRDNPPFQDRGDSSVAQCTIVGERYDLLNNHTAGESELRLNHNLGTTSAPLVYVGQELYVGGAGEHETVTVASVNYTTRVVTLTAPLTLAKTAATAQALRGKAGIRHESGGGLKLGGCKVLFCEVGYDLTIGAPLGDQYIETISLNIVGLSVENQNVAGIRITSAADGWNSSFKLGTISACEIDVKGDGIIIGPFIEGIAITGNAIRGRGNGVGVNHTAGQGNSTDGNIIWSFSVGVQLAAGVLQPFIGKNFYRACATDYRDDRVLPHAANAGFVDTSRTKAIINATSTSTIIPAFEIEMKQGRGISFDVVVDGGITGASSGNEGVIRRITKLAHWPTAGGNVALLDVIDEELGAPVDVVFDVTTTPGHIFIGLRRDAGDGASGGTPRLDAHVHYDSMGVPRRFAVAA